MSYEVGTRCWYPDAQVGFIGGEITKHTTLSNKHQLTLELENGEVVEIETETLDEQKDSKLPLLRNPPILEATEDLTSLSYLNEPAVLHAIKQRYSQLNIYTYSGIVLIATNPFDRVDQLYSQDMIQAYAGKRRGELEPHLFAIAEEAYRFMKTNNENQTIVVSGESGAGKTVSAKYIMRYFASVEASNDESSHHLEMSKTEQQILATNPIMEAFGNAKTTRNDNSSRFGKYLEILFDGETSIIGARVRTYLLERSRLVFQPSTERNYHIFYQLLSGLSASERAELELGDIDEYFYLNQGGDYHIKGVDDAAEYKITVDALQLVGISPATQHELFKILAALLHIGNIEVTKTRNDALLNSDEPNLVKACKLLGIDPASFAKWIVKKQITTRSEKIVSNLNYQQATVARDSVAKFIYSALFDWLVENINTVLCNPEVVHDIKTFIGVLDIYGFEHFEKNSFEQFCINYANEKLQQEFNQHVFKLEQEEYIKEQIEWSFIEFNDNQPCIDLIEKKLGILSLLDEESRLPAGSDETWIQKLYDTLDKAPTNKVFKKPRFGQTKFVVTHYALDVTYDIDGFIEKNRDTVSDGHLETLKASTNETLQSILETIDKSAAALAEKEAANKKPGARTVNRKPTLGSIFKNSLIDLMATIESTNVHYIRCIKPNEAKEAWQFDPLMVLSQLRACGVLETIRISCAGFPSRWTYDEFASRYHILIPSKHWSKMFTPGTTEEDIRALCNLILDTTVEDKQKYQLGNTKIFFKAGMLAYLEKLRSDKLNASIVLIQKNIKGIYYRMQYLEICAAIRKTQAQAKGVVARIRAHREMQHNAATKIQTLVRGHTTRKNVTELLQSIVRVQALVRLQIARREIKAKRDNDAAIAIQNRIRGFVPRAGFLQQKKATVVVQNFVRRKFAQRELAQLKADAKSVEHMKEVSYKMENKVIQLTESLALKVKENKELAGKIENLQKSLKESEGIKALMAQQQSEHAQQLEDQSGVHATAIAAYETDLAAAKKEYEQAKIEIESLMKEQEALKADVRAKVEEINKVRQELSDSQTNSSDLQSQVESLKSEVAKLQLAIKSNAVGNAFSTPKRMSMQSFDSTASPRQLAVVAASASAHDDDDVKSTLSALSQINDELYRLLEDTKSLNGEIVEGLLKSVKVPQTGVAVELSRKEVLYPARILIIILSDMWRLGLTKQSEAFLAEVLSAIQKLVSQLKEPEVVPHGAFWLTNVRELYSFVVFAQNSILNDDSYNADMNEEEYKEYVTLVAELKEDFEALSYNIYNIWMKKLHKDLEKKAISSVVMAQSLPGFVAPESSPFLPKLFSQNVQYKMDDILSFFNNIYWSMKSFHIEMDVLHKVIVTLLEFVDAVCFNDLIMRRNFLSWKRGLQLNYNVTRLEEWCKSHHIPEGTECLSHMLQASKSLQLRKSSVEDIDIIFEICYSLRPIQIQKLITQYLVADYELPIPASIQAYVAERVKNHGAGGDAHNELFVPVPNGHLEDPFNATETRQFGKIEAYIPAWLNLPITRRIVELITKNVNVAN